MSVDAAVTCRMAVSPPLTAEELGSIAGDSRVLVVLRPVIKEVGVPRT
jgi:hypothetical protein